MAQTVRGQSSEQENSCMTFCQRLQWALQGTILRKTGVEGEKVFSVLQTPFGSFAAFAGLQLGLVSARAGIRQGISVLSICEVFGWCLRSILR